MKALKSVFAIAFFISATFTTLATDKIEGSSNTKLGNYFIEKADTQIQHEGVAIKTYVLNYENFKKEILIGVEDGKKCKNFHVRIDDMEIIYSCEKSQFGARKLPKQKDTQVNVKEAIDRQQFFYQKVITQKPKTEEELLGLIACYFPKLLKEGFILK
ncbi:hypothetical protein DMA11_00525 [Marinilabiliaceae bacterium JC017]|nr:hypothetical protein DMA11_00525 [Marinilabiliaceae bacterium JC017]